MLDLLGGEIIVQICNSMKIYSHLTPICGKSFLIHQVARRKLRLDFKNLFPLTKCIRIYGFSNSRHCIILYFEFRLTEQTDSYRGWGFSRKNARAKMHFIE